MDHVPSLPPGAADWRRAAPAASGDRPRLPRPEALAGAARGACGACGAGPGGGAAGAGTLSLVMSQ